MSVDPLECERRGRIDYAGARASNLGFRCNETLHHPESLASATVSSILTWPADFPSPVDDVYMPLQRHPWGRRQQLYTRYLE